MSIIVDNSPPKVSSNNCMSQCIISMSNVPHKQKKEIKRRIQLLGGKYVDQLTKRSTHLITQDWTTAKSIHARHNKKPIVMSPAWVDACEHQKDSTIKPAWDESFNKYKLPVFHGFTLCFSQVPLDKRKAIKKRVEKNGGKYSPNLDPARVTHLVLVKAFGEKFRTAKKCGKFKIVHFNWFLDSMAQGIPLPEDKYPPDDSEDNQVSHNTSIHNKGHNSSIENRDETLQRSDLQKEEDHFTEETNKPADGNGLEPPTRPMNHQEGIKESSLHNIPEPFPVEASQPMVKETKTQQEPIRRPAPLAGCVICLSRFIDGRLGEMYKLIKDLGGTSATAIDSTTTHLVIRGKSCEKTDEYSKAKKLNINIVDINWLRKYSPPDSKATNKRKSTVSFPRLQEFMPENRKRAKSNLFSNQSNITPKKDRAINGSKATKGLEKADEFENLLENLDADQVSLQVVDPSEPTKKERVVPPEPIKFITLIKSQSSDSLTDSLPIAWG